MTYIRKHKEVQAIQLKGTVCDTNGNKVGLKDDWLVIEGEEQYYMTNAAFMREFEPKPQEISPIVPLPYPVPYEPLYPWHRYCDGDDETITTNEWIFDSCWDKEKHENLDEDTSKNTILACPGFVWSDLGTTDELTKKLFIWSQPLDNSDLRVSFNVI
jgi:hypothetical protein